MQQRTHALRRAQFAQLLRPVVVRHPNDFAVPESHLFAEQFDTRARVLAGVPAFAAWKACTSGASGGVACGAARRRCRILSRALIAAPFASRALPQESRQMLALQAIARFCRVWLRLSMQPQSADRKVSAPVS
jgi:hypothetical protein